MNPNLKTFEDLNCWQACRNLRLFVAKEVLPALPGNEKYRLSDQILRAARSTTANLSEGFGRFHYMDNAKFCSNSRGSSYEVLDHLITACDEDLLPPEMLEKGRKLVNSAVKLINGYMRYLKNQAKQPRSIHEDISIYKTTTPLHNPDYQIPNNK